MVSDHDLLAKNAGFFNAGCQKSANDGLSGGARACQSPDLTMDIGVFAGGDELP
jgi:hypothetical protein